MRIIAGKCKGTLLEGNFEIRPTLDRIKETLFNILHFDLPDAPILDLFSGNGSLGIEALSRGAKHCTFVERNPKNYEIIRRNLEKTNLKEQATLLLGDAFLFSFSQPYQFIFIDPPFIYHTENPQLTPLLEKALQYLSPGGALIIEHPKKITVLPHLQNPRRVKEFHNTSITLLFSEEETPTPENNEEKED